MADFPGFLHRHGGAVVRLGDVEVTQQLPESLAILRQVNRLRRSSNDGHAGVKKLQGQLERSLSTKLDDNPIRFFFLYNGHHILKTQWLKVESIRGVIVCGHRLRIAVDHNGLKSRLFQSEGGVATAIVKLNSLADAIRPASQNNDLPALGRFCLILSFISGVKVRRIGLKFCCTGVNTFKDRQDAVPFPIIPQIQLSQ